MVALHPHPLAAPYPTDGCSASGALHLPARGLAELAEPVLIHHPGPGPGGFTALAGPTPTRYVGTRRPRTPDGRPRVVILEDGLPPLELPGELPAAPWDWGRPSWGARRLALHLLREQCGAEAAYEMHRAFCGEVVAGLPDRGWALNAIDLTDWCLKHGADVDAEGGGA
jgi:hypothetical protein